MKNNYFLLFLYGVLFLSACSKSKDAGITYEPLTDGVYVVNSGVITFTDQDSTITFTAPKDPITVYLHTNELNPGMIIIAKKNIKSDSTYQSWTMGSRLTPKANTTITRSEGGFNPNYVNFVNGKTVDGMGSYFATLTITDYNMNGMLMSATYNGSAVNLSPHPTAGPEFSGTISLKLNKK
jgi:hypothetical protein